MTAVVITIIEISGDVAIVIPLITSVVISRAIANKIAHHSYTHESFYKLLDIDAHGDETPFVHPGDWAPLEMVSGKDGKSVFKKVRRSTTQTGPTGLNLEEIAAEAAEAAEAAAEGELGQNAEAA